MLLITFILIIEALRIFRPDFTKILHRIHYELGKM